MVAVRSEGGRVRGRPPASEEVRSRHRRGRGSTAAKFETAARTARARTPLAGSSVPGASRVEITACLDIIGPDEKADEGEPSTGPSRGRLGEGRPSEELPLWRVVSLAEASGGLLARRSGTSATYRRIGAVF